MMVNERFFRLQKNLYLIGFDEMTKMTLMWNKSMCIIYYRMYVWQNDWCYVKMTDLLWWCTRLPYRSHPCSWPGRRTPHDYPCLPSLDPSPAPAPVPGGQLTYRQKQWYYGLWPRNTKYFSWLDYVLTWAPVVGGVVAVLLPAGGLQLAPVMRGHAVGVQHRPLEKYLNVIQKIFGVLLSNQNYWTLLTPLTLPPPPPRLLRVVCFLGSNGSTTICSVPLISARQKGHPPPLPSESCGKTCSNYFHSVPECGFEVLKT